MTNKHVFCSVAHIGRRYCSQASCKFVYQPLYYRYIHLKSYSYHIYHFS